MRIELNNPPHIELETPTRLTITLYLNKICLDVNLSRKNSQENTTTLERDHLTQIRGKLSLSIERREVK